LIFVTYVFFSFFYYQPSCLWWTVRRPVKSRAFGLSLTHMRSISSSHDGGLKSHGYANSHTLLFSVASMNRIALRLLPKIAIHNNRVGESYFPALCVNISKTVRDSSRELTIVSNMKLFTLKPSVIIYYTRWPPMLRNVFVRANRGHEYRHGGLPADLEFKYAIRAHLVYSCTVH